jgi:hypothetical protein
MVVEALGEASITFKLVNLTSSVLDVSLKLKLAKTLPDVPIEIWPFDGWFDVLIVTLRADPTELTVKVWPCTAVLGTRETEVYEVAPVPESPATFVTAPRAPVALLNTSA